MREYERQNDEQYGILLGKDEYLRNCCEENDEIFELIDVQILHRRRHAAAVDTLHLDFRTIQNRLISNSIQLGMGRIVDSNVC